MMDMEQNQPSIWYANIDLMQRLDHPEYQDYLDRLNLRDLRLIKAVLDCSMDAVNARIEEKKDAKG